MSRKRKITKLDLEVREYVEQHIRENRLTLGEIVADLQQRFPEEAAAGALPGTPTLWREHKRYEALRDRAMEQMEMAAHLIKALGEDPEGQLSQLMLQAATTLTTTAMMAAQEAENIDPDELLKLSRSIYYITAARAAERKEREREESRRELQQEQRERLGLLGQTGQIDAETLGKVIRAAYDL